VEGNFFWIVGEDIQSQGLLRVPNILVISPSNIFSDPRVTRHINAAMSVGKVTSCGFGEENSATWNHLSIPMNTRFTSKSLFTLLLIQLGFYQTAARRTSFYKEAMKLLKGKDEQFDLVVLNDVHSLQLGLDLFPADKIWADMHEYAPREGEHDWRWRLVYKRYVAGLCKRHLSKVRVVTSVGFQICQQYQRDLCRPVDLIRNVSPYVSRNDLPDKSFRSSEVVHLVHVGVAIRARVLENMILAVQGNSQIVLHLYVLPTERRYYDELITLARGSSNVVFEHPVELSEIISEIAKYDAGIITIPPTSFNYENGLPNKLFQYLQARLPILSGPLNEIIQIVNSYNIGIITNDFSVASIKRAIQEFVSLEKNYFDDSLDKAAIELSNENEDLKRLKLMRSVLKIV
jgi:hypothetical protein